jgi:NADPH:quinone reductase
VDERIAGRAPASLSLDQATALPLTGITAYESLFERLGFSAQGGHAGQSLLVIGGAGGVGSIAIQLAKQFAQLTVIATASRPESREWVKQLGADHVINHFEDIAAQLKALDVPQVDAILILNDTDHYFPHLAQWIAPQGKIVSIVETAKPHNLDSLKSKSATFAWEFMFTRSMYRTPDMVAQHHMLNAIADAIDRGTIKTTVGEHFGTINASNLKRAHAALEQGHVVGKIVLSGF